MKTNGIRVLIACEESQAVCIEFRKLGFEAYSCDLLPCSGGHPEWHIQGDLLQEKGKYDFVISFPPCTDLAVSGAAWFEKKRNTGEQEKSIRLFFEVWQMSNCCENPVGILNGGKYVKKWFPQLHAEMLAAGFPFQPDQTIEPYYYGDAANKKTCLWLRGLPALTHTHRINILKAVLILLRPAADVILNGVGIRAAVLVKSEVKRFQVLLKLWQTSGARTYLITCLSDGI